MPSEADRRQLLVHAPTPGWTRSRHARSPSSRELLAAFDAADELAAELTLPDVLQWL
ncbi:MAG: hypothetical protein J2P28_05350 [Actinobacteria bacterium]|nr:hypothetical protein [Actinomycetota bacterium]